MTSTIYDDVFRTLLNDCSALIIPVINELFNENYSGNEFIEFRPNEHFINQQDGNEDKRITDTYFIIHGLFKKGYHLECQSSDDGSLLVRIFEYDSQIALDEGVLENNTLRVKFPNSAVLFLRSSSVTPDRMNIVVEFPNGSFRYEIPAMKVQDYSLEQIFNKGLLFLLPFYIFSHQKHFREYERDESKLNSLLDEYKIISQRLDDLVKDGTISEYIKCTIHDMTGRVVEQLAKNYSGIREGVKDIMVGKILDYEAKDILKMGIAEGISKGIAKGELSMLLKLVRNKLLSLADASRMADLTEEEFSRLSEN
ncbi:MAG: hypothetical protein IJ697_08490 [Synergistaceae bacterium]|nr:hypothetical protein [Synergistaceae bacterium]